jgi:hypothetical protein
MIACPMTSEISPEYRKQSYCVIFTELRDLLSMHKLSIEKLKDIASAHSLPVAYRPRKTVLLNLLSKHSCAGRQCCVYVFKIRGNPCRCSTRVQKAPRPLLSFSSNSPRETGDVDREIDHSKKCNFPMLLSDDDKKNSSALGMHPSLTSDLKSESVLLVHDGNTLTWIDTDGLSIPLFPCLFYEMLRFRKPYCQSSTSI